MVFRLWSVKISFCVYNGNMSKAVKKVRNIKKAVEVVQSNKIRTDIPAGMAAAGPPLGPMLGQVCKINSLADSCLIILVQRFIDLISEAI